MELITGFEPTRIITKEKGLSEMIDILETSGHYQNYEKDLELVKSHGIKTLRVAFPWHRIEYERGKYDWTWMDAYMKKLDELGIEAISDPLHHVSIPSWLTLGFLDEEFVATYIRFFQEIVFRYPQMTKHVIVNEPLVTTYFATKAGIWYPFHNSDESFLKALKNVAYAIKYCSQIVKKNNHEHFYIEPAEDHKGMDEISKVFAEYKQNYKFMLLDLLLGKVNLEHPMYRYYAKVFSGADFSNFSRSKAYITTLGLDYYSHCEFEWESDVSGQIIRNENQFPIGFAEIAKQYAERYPDFDIALTETNIRGYVTDRQTWFKHMYEECQKVQSYLQEKGREFKYFCWYPFIDCTDWDSLVTQCNRNIDPQGIIILCDKFNRNDNEFAQNVKKLAKGEISIEDVPEYDYLPPLDEKLIGFIQLKYAK